MNKKIISIFKFIKRIFIDMLVIFLVLYILSFFLFNPWIYTNDIQKARDTTVLSDVINIQKSLENSKEFNFSSFENYKNKYNTDIKPPKGCYYLKSTESNNSYILVVPLESSKFKKKYWNDYFLYKSDLNYVIDDSRMDEIKSIISYRCKD
jgi:predicted RND superfamily exporter protein